MLMYQRDDEFQAKTQRHLLGNEMEEIKMLTMIIFLSEQIYSIFWSQGQKFQTD